MHIGKPRLRYLTPFFAFGTFFSGRKTRYHILFPKWRLSMVSKNLQLVFIVLFIVGAGDLGPVKAEAQAPTIILNRSVHFFSTSGDSAIVQAGTYGVETAEDWLRFIPQSPNWADGMLLEADRYKIDGLLEMPQALSEQNGQDPFHHAH